MALTFEKDHFDVNRQIQEKYQNTLDQIGVRVPPPVLGQSVNEYRCEMLRQLKRTFLPQNNEYYRLNYRGLKNDSAALNALEPLALQEILVQAQNPMNVPKGEIREIKEYDRDGRHIASRFIGQDSFVKFMSRPGRRVLSFNTPTGPIDSSGRFLR
jgi:hypothetical protein